MLIRFSVENFRSINEEVVFSMIPGRMQKHSEHIISFPKQGIDALRVALLYGANASGKSNLVRAMDFARNFIVEGTRPKQSIPFEPFRLDKTNIVRPSRFEFEFAAEDQVYAYGFLVDGKRVHEEWLYLVNSKDERPIFERETTTKNVISSDFRKIENLSESDQQFLSFVTRGTRPNQLLLTALAENNVERFEPIYEWFRSTLVIIFPHSHNAAIQAGVHEDQDFSQDLAKFLQAMNTGINEVWTKSIEIESLNLPIDLITEKLDGADKEAENAPDKMTVINTPEGRYLIHQNESGVVEAYTLGTRHYVEGRSVEFDLSEESDGTQRLFDLFPILYGTENRVFVIDELERSLHPNLVRRFIKTFLEVDKSRQLIVTTHESTLLDLSLLRRDEIWFIEKSPSGSSVVYSLEEFKPRNDLDIRKGYLQGRFGAIPIIGSLLNKDLAEA